MNKENPGEFAGHFTKPAIGKGLRPLRQRGKTSQQTKRPSRYLDHTASSRAYIAGEADTATRPQVRRRTRARRRPQEELKSELENDDIQSEREWGSPQNGDKMDPRSLVRHFCNVEDLESLPYLLRDAAVNISIGSSSSASEASIPFSVERLEISGRPDVDPVALTLEEDYDDEYFVSISTSTSTCS